MKISFEYWKEEKRFSKKINSLFDESVLCYKHGAYRASLLFSYLALLTFVKEHIIKSAKPAAVPQGRWDNLLAELQNDRLWEERTLEEINNSASSIFSDMKEDLRQQIRYWKDRRNDCAHFKDNEIESHHTESLWSFIKSNLSKITIEGGRQSLVNKFRNHFDETKTPPNSDFAHLIYEIEHVVDSRDLKGFIGDISLILDPDGWGNPRILKIFNKMFELCPERLTEVLARYILDDHQDVELISLYPDKISYLALNEQQVRELWKRKAMQNETYRFNIYAALVRNELIPHAELKEALTSLFERYDQTVRSFPNDTGILRALTHPVLGDVIFNNAILGGRLSDYMWTNSKSEFIAFYVERFPLRLETVKILCEMVSWPNCSWWLRDAIKRVLTNVPSKKAEFHRVASENNITVPAEFQ